jgi:hypothetical protein
LSIHVLANEWQQSLQLRFDLAGAAGGQPRKQHLTLRSVNGRP